MKKKERQGCHAFMPWLNLKRSLSKHLLASSLLPLRSFCPIYPIFIVDSLSSCTEAPCIDDDGLKAESLFPSPRLERFLAVCECVISSVFAVALNDAYALCTQRFAAFEATVKASFFSRPISINHSSPEAPVVGD